jgi:hypothetical protein
MGEIPAVLLNPLVVSVTRRIDEPAAKIFAVLRDPKRHCEIDGTSTLRTSDAPQVTAFGDAFVTRTHNEEFGGDEMRNHVVGSLPTAPSRGRRSATTSSMTMTGTIAGVGVDLDGGATQVTAVFDCTRVREDGRRILRVGSGGGPTWSEVSSGSTRW